MKKEWIILEIILILLCITNTPVAAEKDPDPRIRIESAINNALKKSEILYQKARGIALQLQSEVKSLKEENSALKEQITALNKKISELEKENRRLKEEGSD